jgi:penicillin-binding protein 1A
MRPEPRMIDRVEDRTGRIVYAEAPSARSVLDRSVAFLTTSILQDVVNRGTGTGVRAAGFRGPAGGKTGTTQDAADAWFVGFTPDVVTTVWFGLDERKTIVRGTTGGELAAPVWGRVMRRIGARSSTDWEAPAGVERRTIDEYGNVVDESCPGFGATRNEYFLLGTAPSGQCRYPYDYYLQDTLGYGDIAGDTTGRDDGWWDRLRNRVFGRDTINDTTRIPVRTTRPPVDTLRRDTLRRDTLRRDTLRTPPDTLIRRDTTQRQDTLVRRPPTRGDTLRQDTLMRRPPTRADTLRRDTLVRRDTLRAPPDTVARADTLRV